MIANVLQTRRKTVVLVTLFDEYAIWMAESEIESGKEIEEKIVIELIRRHSQFIEERMYSFLFVCDFYIFRTLLVSVSFKDPLVYEKSLQIFPWASL